MVIENLRIWVEETMQIVHIKESVQNSRGNFKIYWYQKVINQ